MSENHEANFFALPDPLLPAEAATAPVVIAAWSGSRLEQLLASYESVKAQADEAKARLEALTDALKAEASAAAPAGTQEMILSGGPGLPRMRLAWKSPYRFDVKRFRTENPALYVRYEVRGGHWQLRMEQ